MIARCIPLAACVALFACVPSPRGEPPAAPSPPPTASAEPAPRLTYTALDIPDAPPAPFDEQSVAPDARPSAAGTYTVQPGDTLRRIAERTGAGSEAIARANGLEPPFTIRAGRTLRIPSGRWHAVRAGQTGIAIARAYGVEWSRIAELNRLEPPYILRTGQRLLLPSAGEVARMSVEQRAQAFRLDIGDIITGGEPAIAETAEPARPVKTSPRRTPLPASVAIAPSGRFDGDFAWPLAGPIVRGFGAYGAGRRSDGIDIGTRAGAPILAAADGVVSYAGTSIASYGGLILIKHSPTLTTAYGHAGELMVSRGQAVRKGQMIGRAGDAGAEEGAARLHFEIRQGAKPLDPASRLPRRG